VVVAIVAYMSIAQFTHLPYWRIDIFTESGLFEYLLLTLTVVGLVGLAKREQNRTRRSAGKT